MNPCPGVQRHRHGNARWLRQDHRLDLTEVAVDGSLHKSPCGGKGTGKNPTDRAKLGWKWSIATDRHGIPIGWTAEGVNRNDSILLAPTLDDVAKRGLLVDIETLWLDRGYDSNVTRTRLVECGIDDAGAVSYTHLTLPTKRIV